MPQTVVKPLCSHENLVDETSRPAAGRLPPAAMTSPRAQVIQDLQHRRGPARCLYGFLRQKAAWRRLRDGELVQGKPGGVRHPDQQAIADRYGSRLAVVQQVIQIAHRLCGRVQSTEQDRFCRMACPAWASARILSTSLFLNLNLVDECFGV